MLANEEGKYFSYDFYCYNRDNHHGDEFCLNQTNLIDWYPHSACPIGAERAGFLVFESVYGAVDSNFEHWYPPYVDRLRIDRFRQGG